MAEQKKFIRIGTRGSPLALQQAEAVKRLLYETSNGLISAELVPMTTSGDKLTTQRLIEAGGKGLFTKEIDRALEAGQIDIAVHSLKDVPSILPFGQDIFACLKREDPREGFISLKYTCLEDLPEGAVFGTASIRREAQSRYLRPDLNFVPFRGNVQTRLKKLEAGEAEATYLAMAGLTRLGLAHLAQPIDLAAMPPAPCQGIVAVAAIAQNLSPELIKALAAINNKAAARAAAAERSFLRVLDGSCRTPIAAHLFEEAHAYRFFGEVIHPDGTHLWNTAIYSSTNADIQELEKMGERAAEDLLQQAGGALPQFEA